MQVILVRFSEIHLKGNNKSYFLKLLKNNIKEALKEFNCQIESIPNRYVIKASEDELYHISERLKKVVGIHSISFAEEIDTNIENIKKICQNLKINGSFKVDVNRADKSFPIKSCDFNSILGEIILNNNKLASVDVKKPDKKVQVDIRENGKTYIFSDIIYLKSGLPLSEYRDGLLLLSGGIDSPVAGYMMSKRGMRQDILHFDSYPYTSPMAKEKVIKLAKIIKPYIGAKYMYIVSMTKLQEAFHLNCKTEYAINLLRRSMIMIASKLCEKFSYKAIITGESLGQVASQTIESITTTNNASSYFPILRPLIAFNKEEIIAIAKEINTFETSILPYEDCCTVFLPRNPVIKPKLEISLNEEKKIPLQDLISEVINNMEIIELN